MRTKIINIEVGEIKTGTSERGAWSKLPFKGQDEQGKVLSFFTFKKDLFDAIKGNKTAEVEYEEKTREYDGQQYIDRAVSQVYVNGEPVIKKSGWSGGGRSPENTASIESQCAYKGIIELMSAGVLALDSEYGKTALKWAMQRLNGSTAVKPGDTPVTKPQQSRSAVAPPTPKPETEVTEATFDKPDQKPQDKKEEGGKAKRDPSTIKNFGDLYRACSEDFKMKTRAEVWRELGVNSQEAISNTPAECYQAIASTRGA